MRRAGSFFAAAAILFVTVALGQQPVLQLTANTVNVREPGNKVRIDIMRWSTEQERTQLATALNVPAPATAEVPPLPVPAESVSTAGAEGTGAARGARGGARGGAAGAGARGGGARGGRGGNAGPVDPIATFTAAIGKAPTIGYIWTNEVTGYSIKYAVRLPLSEGNERIILATNRRIGANSSSWTPAGGAPNSYEFTVLEIRLTSRGSGEGKASLTTGIGIDKEAKTIGLENYAATSALLENVKRN